MLRSRLSETDLAQVVRRAQEIETGASLRFEDDPEVVATVNAMVESGISKDAAMQALKERLEPPAEESMPLLAEFAPEDMVWAASEDGWCYPARVMSRLGAEYKILYMTGSEGTVAGSTLKRFNIHPGLKVHILQSGMWCEADVTSFNKVAQTLNANYYWTPVSVSMDAVKMKDKSREVPLPAHLQNIKDNLGVYIGVFATGGGLGFALAAILGFLR
jgi:hypothetical protein